MARRLETLERSVAALDADTRKQFDHVYEAILGLDGGADAEGLARSSKIKVETPQPHSTTLQAHHLTGAPMKVLVFVKATANSEKGIFPPETEKLFADMGKFNEQLVKAGIMESADGLKPSSAAKRIRFSDSGASVVIDGPFAETKELVAGYWIWNVKSLDEAVEWAKRCPNPMPGEEGVLEIRPCYSLEDFERSCRQWNSSAKPDCASRWRVSRSRSRSRRPSQSRPGQRRRRPERNPPNRSERARRRSKAIADRT